MGQVAEAIVAKCGSIIASKDVAAAIALEKDDDAMDDLHRELFAALLDENTSWSRSAILDLTLVGRYYERFADHAVSVARRVIYLVTGEYDQTVDHEDEEDAEDLAALERGSARRLYPPSVERPLPRLTAVGPTAPFDGERRTRRRGGVSGPGWRRPRRRRGRPRGRGSAHPRVTGGSVVELVDERHAGRDVEAGDVVVGDPVERLDEGAQRVAVGGDHDGQPVGEVVLDLVLPVGQQPRHDVLEALGRGIASPRPA